VDSHCLINAVTAEVDLGAGNFTGFPTNRELTVHRQVRMSQCLWRTAGINYILLLFGRCDFVLSFRYALYIGLIAVLFAFSPGESSTQTAVEEKHQFNRDIGCVIQTERNKWNRTTDAVISGTLENLTNGPLGVELDAHFYLSSRTGLAEMGDKYWAPVDLLHDKPISIEKHPVRPDKILPVPIRLRFKSKGDKIDFRIDAQHLLWAKVISSVWPSSKLFTTVKSDEYDLQLVLETDSGTVESSKVKVSIDASETPKR
jgi:hypothetical protein